MREHLLAGQEQMMAIIGTNQEQMMAKIETD
jgi:hypothetical protein